jgi:hypothetical protein
VVAFSEDKQDYSNYHQIGANLITMLGLLSGFTFTGITILLSQFSVLNSLATQFVLFFLSCLFFLFMLLLGMAQMMQLRLCKNKPPVTRQMAFFNLASWVSYLLLQVSVVVMFLIWGLVYLTLATGVALAIFYALYISGFKRDVRYRTETEDKT